MPRENRKRGKKHKKSTQSSVPFPASTEKEQPEDEPSWILKRDEGRVKDQMDAQAPFGYVEADVKAYFRTVDIEMRNWQESQSHGVDHDGGGELDPNEVTEKRLFFVAALNEMAGKEKQLATDPECSHILERMIYSMDDFVRRVFVDSLAGSYATLVKNRFASHVCQTMLTVAVDTVYRESKGILPGIPDSPDHGELRTMTQLVLDICEELLPTFNGFISDPFASHVIRALLLLLWPSLVPSSSHKHGPANRSKKSASWAARQGPMKSLFLDGHDIETQPSRVKNCPDSFNQAASKFIGIVRDDLDSDETRALAIDKVASPVLQMLLEMEADMGTADQPDSLMDRVLVGLITTIHTHPNPTHSESDFVATLLRDATSSHLLETLVWRAPPPAFDMLWSAYFLGKLPRLAMHPIANFVLAKALGRGSAVQLGKACAELDTVAGDVLKMKRAGVLRALVDRAAELGACEKEVNELIFKAFGLETGDDCESLISAALQLVSTENHETTSRSTDTSKKGPQRGCKASQSREQPTESNMQGPLLLQSLLRFPHPHNYALVESINSLSVESRLQIARSPINSRIMDALLDSPTVLRKDKRAFVISFIGHFQLLADDRIGSRVADKCWAFADPYLKEKIARSLFSHEQFLVRSFYGKYFSRKLNLHLLTRRPDEWRNLQVQSISEPTGAAEIAPPVSDQPAWSGRQGGKRKRGIKVEDEIDALFNGALGSGVKKAALNPGSAAQVSRRKRQDDLGGLMDAIRAAPGTSNAIS